ncbi:hypothetical protein EST38_g14163 [Candolleomyces aberdarensis]|uniref:Uncharacterized protein n=1 Tax=Candolleomyces aberdarensis TaxID=2316362 RepID=A0A4Q2CZ41_9AGAR|nr:hypothetical protein EST38_g14163 [Candolleomyces aberdarensis]
MLFSGLKFYSYSAPVEVLSHGAKATYINIVLNLNNNKENRKDTNPIKPHLYFDCGKTVVAFIM